MSSFKTSSPKWQSSDLSALPNWSGLNLCEFVVDPFSPLYLHTGMTVNGWLVTGESPNAAILRITDIGGSPAITNQKTIFVGTDLAVYAQFERAVPGWGIVVSSSGSGTIVYYTTDGVNWTTVNVDTYYDIYGNPFRCGLTINPHAAGEAYISTLLVSGASNAGTPPSGVMLKTTNYGASWVSTGLSVGYMKSGAIVMPYAAPDYLFHGYRTGSGTSVYRLYRSRLSTGAQTDISPVVDGHVYGVDNNQTNRQISIADDDPNWLLFVGTSVSAGKRAVFRTRNALAAVPTWEIIVQPVAFVSSLYIGSYFVSRGYAILFGIAGNIAVFDGNTLYDKTGDLTLGAPVIGLCGL